MAVTEQTNTTLNSIAETLSRYDSFAVCGHVNPDGDCLGSQLALALALEQMGKRVVRLLVRDEPIDAGLRFLPGADALVPASSFEGSVQVFIALDVPLVSRIEAAAAIQDGAELKVTVDHHAVDSSMSDLNYVDPDAPATGLLVWDLIRCMDVTPSAEIATCCYTALMTDTGRFQYQNTRSESFAAASEMVSAGASPAVCSREVYQRRSVSSLMLENRMLEHAICSASGSWVLSYLSLDDFSSCNAIKADAEPLVDILRSIDGVEVACILREHPENVRGSLRAKGDFLDVSLLARHIGGGGHKAAAGFTFERSLSEVRELMPLLLEALCSADRTVEPVALNALFSEVESRFEAGGRYMCGKELIK